MYALAEALDPDSMRAVGARVYARDGGGRLRRGRRVPLRPPPARRDARTTTRTRWRSRCAEAALAAGLRDRPAPRRLPPRAGTRAPSGSGASATRPSRPSSSASTRCAPGRRARDVSVGVAAHSVRAVPAHVAGGDRRLRARPTASSATSTPTSSRASWRSAAPSTAARRSSCSSAPASSATAPRSCTASTSAERDIELLADSRARSSPPARRPRATSATATSPALAYRDAGVRLAIGLRQPGGRRPVRGGPRARDRRAARAPDPPRAARRRRRPLGTRWPRTAARASGSTTPERRRSTSTIRVCRASEDADVMRAVATCASADVVA